MLPLPETATARPYRKGRPSAPWRRPALFAALVTLVALYMVSRLSMLLALPIFFDEAHYTLSAWLIGHDPMRTSPFVEVAYWGVPPLFTWIAAPLTRLVAAPLLAGRLAAASIGALGLVALWACGREVGGRGVALLALAFYVLSPFVLLYTRMAMVDGLLAVIGAFALLAALRLARAPDLGAALMLGACCAAAVFSKIFGPLDMALAGAAVLAAPAEQRRRVARLAMLPVLMGLLAFLALLLAPGGGSLILVATQQQGGATPLMTRALAQLSLIGQSYWLYMTPPILALALIGTHYCKHEPGRRVLLAWAILAWLPFVVVHLSARYLLSGAIPLLLLAACGAVGLATRPPSWRGRGGLAARRVLAGMLVALAAGACIGEDVLVIATPARAAFVANDREQYISGWPAGYALTRALADVRRLARGRSMTLIAPLQNPPADDLLILIGRDPHVHLVFRDLTGLQGAALRSHGAPTFVVVCRPVGQRIDARRAGLYLVISVPNLDGDGGVYLYAPSPAASRE